MGVDSKEGVVDNMCKLFRGKTGNQSYEDLYVVGSSVFPTSIGVNPSLTVVALALTIAEHIAG